MYRTSLIVVLGAFLCAGSFAPAQGGLPYPSASPPPGPAAVFREADALPSSDGGNVKLWGQAEFLMWWMRDQALPTLVTTSANPGSIGTLGQPDTRVLYGGKADGDLRLGGRFTAGLDRAVDHNGTAASYGTEVVFFFLEGHNNPFNATSIGHPLLAPPFLDVLSNQQFSEQVANRQVGAVPPGPRPGFVRAHTGSVAIDNRSRVWGAELNGTWDAVIGVPNLQVRGLVGFRHFGLKERLLVREDLVLPVGADLSALPARVVLPETAITTTDAFRTRNYFYGPQMGFKSVYRSGAVSVDVIGKLALGWMNQGIDIQGDNVNVVRNGVTGQFLPPVSRPGGLLTQPANIGHYTQTVFCVVPEGTFNLGYDLSEAVRVFVGYNILYVSSVARPADQIDTGLDVRGQSGAAPDANRPAFTFRTTDHWLQGIQVGLDVRY